MLAYKNRNERNKGRKESLYILWLLCYISITILFSLNFALVHLAFSFSSFLVNESVKCYHIYFLRNHMKLWNVSVIISKQMSAQRNALEADFCKGCIHFLKYKVLWHFYFCNNSCLFLWNVLAVTMSKKTLYVLPWETVNERMEHSYLWQMLQSLLMGDSV